MSPAVDAGMRAEQLAALLVLLEAQHDNLGDEAAQARVGWLLPLATEMANDIATAIGLRLISPLALVRAEGGAA